MHLTGPLVSTALVLLATVQQLSADAIVPVPEKRLIVGGRKFNINDVPYQVAITWDLYLVVCGGSLIAPQWVLTGAHCMYDILANKHRIKIRAGSARRDLGGIVRTVKHWKMHPQYKHKGLKNDVALMMMDRPLVQNSNIKCIRMAAQGYIPSKGESGLASGWGLRRAEAGDILAASYPKELYAVELPVIDWNTCKRWYSRYEMFDGLQLCAGYTLGRRDACTGDSGGPYVVNHILIGIVSWGQSCAKQRQPGVYTNVGSYRNWIDAHMRQISNARTLGCRLYY